MKKCFCRMMSVMLSVAFIMSLTSCKKNETTETTGDAFSPESLVEAGTMPSELPEGVDWYDYRALDEVESHIKELAGDEWLEIGTLSYNNELYVLSCSGFDDEGFADFFISVFDKDFNCVRDIPVDKHADAVSAIRSSDQVYIEVFDMVRQSFTKYPIKGDTIDWSDPREYIDKIPSTFDYTYEDFMLPIVDTSNGAVMSRIDLTSIRNDNVDYIDTCKQIADHYAIVAASGAYDPINGRSKYYLVDIDSGSVTKVTDLEWLNGFDPYTFSYVSGKSLCTTSDGIYELDFDKQEATLLFGTDYANCNRYIVGSSKPVMVGEDKIVLRFEPYFRDDFWDTMSETTPTQGLFLLERSDDYEQAGKTVISIATFEAPTYSIAETIYNFNKNSEDGFAVYDTRYRVDINKVDTDFNKLALDTTQAYSQASDKLAVDMLSGDGPDILLSNGYYDRFNNSNAFLDLSDIVDSADPDTYMTNVLDSARVNGKIYQLPTSFAVEGLLASSEAFGGKTGITYDEYYKLVSGYCNGLDPLYSYQETYSRPELMSMLFSNTQDCFIEDGKIDVNKDAFKLFLDYCKTVPKEPYKLDYNDVASVDEFDMNGYFMPVHHVELTSFSAYSDLAEVHGKDLVLCGLPSSDSRGATILIRSSVSVSASTESPEICKEFIRTLLSKESQLGYSTYHSVPVNKEVIMETAEKQLVEVNGYEYNYLTYDESDVDRYFSMLENAETSSITNCDIDMIIYEEAQAYLEDQKSFEEVAETINNRAQTVLDEQA